MAMKRLSYVLVLLAVSVQVACGGLLVNNPAAMNGWSGTISLASGTGGLVSEVDFAVFEPGDFTGIGASNGYVYAFQIFNISASISLSQFTVGLIDNSNAVFAGSFDSGQDEDIALISYASNNFIVAFIDPLLAGNNSKVLTFTSPYAPVTTTTSVINSGTSSNVSNQGATPVPEPCTLSLMAFAGIMLARRRCNS